MSVEEVKPDGNDCDGDKLIEADVHQFAPLTRTPAYLKVRQAIEADILAGILAEGSLLSTETSLCKQFGVTRSTVREGIRLLETSGLVRRGAGKRLIVCRPKSGDVAATTSRALTFSGVTFREAWEMLAIVQPEIAALACDKSSSSDITQLKLIHESLVGIKTKDHEAIVECADRFFMVLAASVKNNVTMAMAGSLNILIVVSLRQVIAGVPNAKKRIAHAQNELIKAIEEQNQDAARQWMRRHIDDLQRGYQVAGMSMDAKIV